MAPDPKLDQAVIRAVALISGDVKNVRCNEDGTLGSGGGGGATDVAIHDFTNTLQHLGVDVNGEIGIHATNLDITLTALANLIKGGATLNNILSALTLVPVTGPLTNSQLQGNFLATEDKQDLAIAGPALLPNFAVSDSSYYGHIGIIKGDEPARLVNWPAPHFGNALFLEGNDLGSNDRNARIDVGVAGTGVTGSFCLELKCVRTRSNDEILAGRWGNTLSTQNYVLFFSSGVIAGSVIDSGGVQQTVSSGVIADGPHDVALTYDGTTLRLYVDGVRVSTTPCSGLQAPDLVTPFLIGAWTNTSGNGFPFRGAISSVRLSNISRYVGATYTPALIPFTPDANSLGIWAMDAVQGPVPTRDDYDDFESFHQTLTGSTDTTITFSSPVRMVKVKNWDTANVVLVKNGAIATNTDSASDRVGLAPTANVPNSETYAYTTSTIHVRSAGASVVTVKGFR